MENICPHCKKKNTLAQVDTTDSDYGTTMPVIECESCGANPDDYEGE